MLYSSKSTRCKTRASDTSICPLSKQHVYHRGIGATAAVSRYPLAHASGLTTSRWDRIVMVTTTRALPLSSQSRLHHSPNTRHTLLLRARICRGRGQPATVCDIYVVDARNRRERGEKQPSSREAHIPCFPSAHLQSLTCVCAKFLWSGELVGVHSRTIAVVGFFSRGLSSKTTRGKFGFHYKGRRSDSARLILPSESQAHFLFRMRYYSRWPQKERRNRGPHVSSLRKSYHVSERLYLFSGLLRLGAMLTSSLIFDSFPV